MSRSEPSTHPIAIVGGGPAGAMAASLLAAGGRDVVLFDEKLAWEKPCGGGVTHKALERYPFLGDAKSGANRIADCELISPSGGRVRFHMRQPVAISSRLHLNQLLLRRARSAGAEIRKERVTRITFTSARQAPDASKIENWQLITPSGEFRASYLVLAAGARNPFRSQFVDPISPHDLMVTAGYFIPHATSLMQIQFLKAITGYIWIFPRADHVSAGIACKMGELPARELRRQLEQWLDQNGFSRERAQFFSHILPSFREKTFASLKLCGNGLLNPAEQTASPSAGPGSAGVAWTGAGWAMLGDSAGLVDPITGEGLYYALRSAELFAEACLKNQPERYATLAEDELLSELKIAARLSDRFYRGQIFGASVLERMISLTGESESFRELMSDLFAGTQGYRGLSDRVYRILPSVISSGLAGTLRGVIKRRPIKIGQKRATKLAANPLAD
jgi:flavin-dependent dehydrogenase